MTRETGNDNYIKDKNKRQLIKELNGTALPGSVVHEQQKMAILVACTEDLETVISNLTRKITYLDYAIAAATIVGAAATALMAYKMFFP